MLWRMGHFCGDAANSCAAAPCIPRLLKLLKREHTQQRQPAVFPRLQTNLPNDWEPPARFKNRFSLAGAVFRTFNVAWELGITPGGVIRTMGPYGAGLIQRYVRNRCAAKPEPREVSIRDVCAR